METIKKKCKIVAMIVNQKTNIAFDINHGGSWEYVSLDNLYSSNYHLYITSDDEIKSGDWCIDTRNGFPEVTKDTGNFASSKKIIATTDTSLWYPVYKNGKDTGANRTLPQPSDSFVRKYCKSGGISEIMVDYSKVVWSMNVNPTLVGKELPKINKDNTITITKIKESWDKEEVENLIRLAMQSKGYTPEYEVREFCKENL